MDEQVELKHLCSCPCTYCGMMHLKGQPVHLPDAFVDVTCTYCHRTFKAWMWTAEHDRTTDPVYVKYPIPWSG